MCGCTVHIACVLRLAPYPGWDEVTLVEDKDELLVGLLFLEVALNVFGPGAHWVPSIEHLN